MQTKLDKKGKKYYEVSVARIEDVPMHELDYLMTTPPEKYPKPYVLIVGGKVFYDSTKTHGILK